MALLEVRNLEKTFGETKVLKKVSFSLEQGQVLVIIGASGGGKTTLLRSLNGLETPDSGEILVNGTPAKGRSDAFGLVFQNYNLFPQYTALQNVTLAPMLKKKGTKAEIRQRAEELLSRVGLSDKAGHYPSQLSGGQQQRVAIARALAMQPQILCFDEPTSALDPELTEEVLQTILDLRKEGRTMIVVTHEMGFAKSVADVIMFIADGVIEEMGTPEQLFDHPESEKTRSFLQHAKVEWEAMQ